MESPLRRPLLVCLPTALTLAGALSAAFLLPERYRASALVRAEWESQEERGRPSPMAAEASRRFQAVRQRALGRAVIERVLQDTRPYASTRGEAMPLEGQVATMLDAIGVRAEGPDTFLIEYVHRDPLKAALIPNRIASLLVEQAESERARRASVDPRVLEARLAEARKTMEEKQAALSSARGRTSASPVEADAASSLRERLEAEKRATALELSAARARLDRLRQAIEMESRPPAPDPGVSAELASLRAQREELRKRYTEEHPDVEVLTRRIGRLESLLPPQPTPFSTPASLQVQLEQVEADIETLSQKAARLEVESTRPSARGLRPVSSPAQDLEALSQDYERSREAFLALSEEWSAAERASRLSPRLDVRFEVREPARVPNKPYFPDRLVFALVGLAVGLMLGVGAAVSAETRDHSVKGPEDLQETLPHPLLVEIPLVSARGSGRRDLGETRSSR